MSTQTDNTWRICSCGTLTHGEDHGANATHHTIRTVADGMMPVEHMRLYAFGVAMDYREIQEARRRVAGHQRGPQQLYITDDGLGAFRGLLNAFCFMGVIAGLCALVVLIVRHGGGR